eukprot:TRINITY_DN31110_c0_g1_i1.p1 TRINITY_DN31110_c0_g1~~TRINITY_DN31110_c0_g1_i1.p1  ORF type:complete len:486 (+),score=101.76 TRINITY_DN31110_c0_g1_i1:64-1521(+)
MAAGRSPSHCFDESTDKLALLVELPTLDSLEGIELDMGREEVQLTLPGDAQPSRIALPPRLLSRLGDPVARFSRKRRQLTVSWALSASQASSAPLEISAGEVPSAQTETADTARPSSTEAPAYGSIWNKNNWHWEEKNCLELATAEVQKALDSSSGLKHVRELGGSSIVIKDLEVKGDASFALRKGKRILCYELTISFKWEGRDEFGAALGVKGTGEVKDLTQEEDDEPEVEIEVSTSSSGGPEARSTGQWMRRAGAKALIQALSAGTLRPAILAAEVAQADPTADLERRKAEEAKAAEAARSAAAVEQQRIAAEQRLRESESRANRPQAGNPDVVGSVWNVNAWHWEEKPMTEWSRSWLSKELSGLSGLQLLAGLAEAEISGVQVSGDASVSVRKGKPIILFQLRIEGSWEVTPTCEGGSSCCSRSTDEVRRSSPSTAFAVVTFGWPLVGWLAGWPLVAGRLAGWLDSWLAGSGWLAAWLALAG